MSFSDLRMRPAREDDLDRLLSIHVAAFPDERGLASRRRNFERNAFGGIDDLRVVERKGIVLAHAFSFRLEAAFGSQWVKTAGIASVGIAPEARGRKVGTFLLQSLEDEARIRGDALAMLYPFRQGFYRKLGYAPVAPLTRIEASPRAIPEHWVASARDADLRAPSGADLLELQNLYERCATQRSGLLKRTPATWERRLLDERRHVLVLDGTSRELDAGDGAERRAPSLRGYLIFQHHQNEPHADVTLRVEELMASDDDPEALRILVGAIGMQRDQTRRFEWLVSSERARIVLPALEDADRDRAGGGTEHLEHALGTVSGGPMLKMLDVERALSARGYDSEDEITLALAHAYRDPARVADAREDDEDDEGQGAPSGARAIHGAATLTVSLGRANVAPHAGGQREPRPIFGSPSAWASVFFGGIGGLDAAKLGWIDGPAESVATLNAVARSGPFEVVDPF